jgi:LacI family transcriptional regulator
MNTVKQDFVKISEEALDELNRLMQGEEGRKVVMPHTLVRIKYEDIIV